MWDTLNFHLDENLYGQLIVRGHFPIYHPPWNPSNGPIKWVFNQLGSQLCLLAHKIDCIKDSMEAIEYVLINLTGFDATFSKCGY